MGTLISQGHDLGATLAILLQIMERHMGVVRGMVNLYHRRTGHIFIHQSLGLSDEEASRGIYSLGEGITGKVVEAGQSIVVPRISQEPAFLNRTQGTKIKGSEEISFVCVPILRGEKVLGTISVERIFDSQGRLQQDVELLTIVAAMIAQAVELYMLENEEKVQLESENLRLQQALKERFHPSNIIGTSSPMRIVYSMIEKISKTKANVLILGESGVGKELVAAAIHYNSQSAHGPFVRFNCAALPETLVESELFGHEKGAFTGASELRKGRFEEADRGTIFLDEIGELSLPLQAKMLRVLQEHSFERVGGNRSINVDIRVLAATNRNLEKSVSEGRFREDLYYRLAVFPILIPPLRERGSDIITLADHFALKFAAEANKAIRGISTPALNLLLRYAWPGNVRELENVIHRAVILTEDDTIHSHHLPPSLNAPVDSQVEELSGSLEAKLDAVEFELLVQALKKTNGNLTSAAEILGLTKRMMSLRMRKFNLEYKTFRRTRLK
jgi:Nif-specific regulatory protein